MEGNIVVDGVLASSYASYDHDAAHIAMTPFRLFPKVIEWIFGKDGGTPTYINIAKQLGRSIGTNVISI